MKKTDGKKILIVEDENALLGFLTSKFKKEGFSVLQARDGEKGLITALQEHPDIILLDIVMPRMDGMTMLAKLRKDSWGKSVPVILLTNLSDSEKISQALELGTFEYLVKADWAIEDIVAKVRKQLENAL